MSVSSRLVRPRVRVSACIGASPKPSAFRKGEWKKPAQLMHDFIETNYLQIFLCLIWCSEALDSAKHSGTLIFSCFPTAVRQAATTYQDQPRPWQNDGVTNYCRQACRGVLRKRIWLPSLLASSAHFCSTGFYCVSYSGAAEDLHFPYIHVIRELSVWLAVKLSLQANTKPPPQPPLHSFIKTPFFSEGIAAWR